MCSSQEKNFVQIEGQVSRGSCKASRGGRAKSIIMNFNMGSYLLYLLQPLEKPPGLILASFGGLQPRV